MSRLKIVSGLPYKIVIESWNTHAFASSQKALLRKAAARGLKEKRERSQSVPLTLPASYSLFLPPHLFPTPRATSCSNEGRRMDLRTSFWPLFSTRLVTLGVSADKQTQQLGRWVAVLRVLFEGHVLLHLARLLLAPLLVPP